MRKTMKKTNQNQVLFKSNDFTISLKTFQSLNLNIISPFYLQQPQWAHDNEAAKRSKNMSTTKVRKSCEVNSLNCKKQRNCDMKMSTRSSFTVSS